MVLGNQGWERSPSSAQFRGGAREWKMLDDYEKTLPVGWLDYLRKRCAD